MTYAEVVEFTKEKLDLETEHLLDESHHSLTRSKLASLMAGSDHPVPSAHLTPEHDDVVSNAPTDKETITERALELVREPETERQEKPAYDVKTKEAITKAYENTAKRKFICNVLAHYTMALSNRVADALSRSRTPLGILTIKPLEIPLQAFELWTRKQLLRCVKGGFQTRKVTTKFVITDVGALESLIDPTCLKVCKSTASGVKFSFNAICTNERPTYITYSRNTNNLNMKLWVIRKDSNELPNLVMR